MKKEPLSCVFCAYRSCWDFALRHHMRLTHRVTSVNLTCSANLDKYKCGICSYETSFKVSLHAHLNYCNQSSASKEADFLPLQCPNCKMKSFSNLVLLSHSLKCENETESKLVKRESFKCGHCSLVSKYPGNLRRHQQYEHESHQLPRFECHQCGFKCKRKQYLIEHIKNIHTEREKKIKCEYCDYLGTSRKAAKAHIMRIHRRQLLICPHCSITYRTPRGLHRHQIIAHSKIYESVNYRCKDCSYKSFFENDFKRHLLLKHGSVKDAHLFKCQQCSYTSVTKGVLREHVLWNHTSAEDAKWFKCKRCNYKSKKSGHLKRHLRRKFSCGVKYYGVIELNLENAIVGKAS